MTTEEMVQALGAGLKPVRPLPRAGSRTVVWSLFALAWVAAGAYALGPRADLLAKIRDPAFLVEGALLVLVSVLAGRTAFLLSVPGAEADSHGRIVPLMGVLVWTCVVAGSQAAASDAVAWSCVAKMCALTLLPAVTALFMLHRAAPLSPGWTGMFALLSAASLALLGTRLLCPRDDPRHVLLWHFIPLLALVGLGARLGRWSLSRRRLLRPM
jgi:hypothetical protein